MGPECAAAQILDALAPACAFLPLFPAGAAEVVTAVSQFARDGGLRAMLLRR